MYFLKSGGDGIEFFIGYNEEFFTSWGTPNSNDPLCGSWNNLLS